MEKSNSLTYAVIGNPVQHSLSPKIHQLFAKDSGIELEYQKIQPEINDFKKSVIDFFSNNGKGCNITVPFKQAAWQLVEQLSDDAKLSQAVNCLTKQEDGSLQGDNFDGVGLVQDLLHNHHYEINQRKILILGAGGATRGILGPLLEKIPEEIVVANRHIEKAVELADLFQAYGNIRGISLTQIPTHKFDLIIHATSLGHQGKAPAIPESVIDCDSFCYDLSYGDAAKPFLHSAQSLGAMHCRDGIGMLVEQAAAAFYLWHGIYPDTNKVIALFSR